ncbi:hypothetical protein [Tenggerimyces flavus]|uniref:Uncharacterized protein n=1 Tax=Tenggerimyces flavus TaxID=1708749 RepID=A0ABV7Y6I0_9ACTN
MAHRLCRPLESAGHDVVHVPDLALHEAEDVLLAATRAEAFGHSHASDLGDAGA